jgi:hypothetical protein
MLMSVLLNNPLLSRAYYGRSRDECIYSNRLVGGIVIILMFMCKNRNELGKYPV